MMRFSEYFNLASKQKDFDFVDVRVDWDNVLFIDPTRIEAESDSLSKECDNIIHDFFNTVLDLYESNKIEEARNSLVYSGESNEIFLGYTEGFPEGAGNSEEGLEKIFTYIHLNDLISKGLIGRIEDLHVFIDEFGSDKMSDLIASLIKAKLVEYTILQCEKYGIQRDCMLTKKYWNPVEHSWKDFSELLPGVIGPGGRLYPVVLVPKRFTVSNYLYDATKYWEKVISRRRQDYHKNEQTQLYLNRANTKGQLNKKEILEAELDGRTLKEYLIDETIPDLTSIDTFRQRIKTTQRSNESNALTDEEIETILKESLERFPSTLYS